MILPVMILQMGLLSLVFGCRAQDKVSDKDNGHGHNESNAVRNWGAQMLDDQTTYYQDLYLRISKPAKTVGQQDPDSTRIKFWLTGSSLEANLVRERVNAHYCELDKQDQESVCGYRDLSLSDLGPGIDKNNEAGLEGNFNLPSSELSLATELIRVRVSYCEVTCATTYLEFSLQDGEVSNSNREPLSGASALSSEDGTIITQ